MVGLPPRPPLAQFGHEILQRDIVSYRETRVTDHPVFFDRGIVDALGILDQQQALSPEKVAEYVRSFSERDQTFAEDMVRAVGLRNH